MPGVAEVSGSVGALLETGSSMSFGMPAMIIGSDMRGDNQENFKLDYSQGRAIGPNDVGSVVVGSDLVKKLGAGAVVLQGSDEPGGVLSTLVRADGSGGELLILPAGGSHQPPTLDTVATGQHYVRMNGREVFRFATRAMGQAAQEALDRAGLTTQDVQWIIPHQANLRIIETAARYLKMPLDRFIINVDRYGNTSTASIPIATVEAIESGKIKNGDKIVLVGFGAGLTWGALAAEWTGALPSEKTIDLQRYRTLGRVRSFLLRVMRFLEGLIWGRD